MLSLQIREISIDQCGALCRPCARVGHFRRISHPVRAKHVVSYSLVGVLSRVNQPINKCMRCSAVIILAMTVNVAG